MNRIVFILCGLLCVGRLFAQEAHPILPPDPKESGEVGPADEVKPLSVSLSFTFWNKYLTNSGGAIYLDKPVLQSDLTLSFDSGLYFDIWNSTGLNGGGFSSDFGDELDLTAGWTTELESGVNLDFGISYFDVLPVASVSKTDVIQPFFEISKDYEIAHGQTISVYGRIEFIFGDANTRQGEFYTHLGLEYTIDFSDEWSFSHKFDICHDPGIYEFESGLIGEYSGALSWKAFENCTIHPLLFRLSYPIDDLDDREIEFIWGAGVEFSF